MSALIVVWCLASFVLGPLVGACIHYGEEGKP
jgi:hypothetical protein